MDRIHKIGKKKWPKKVLYKIYSLFYTYKFEIPVVIKLPKSVAV